MKLKQLLTPERVRFCKGDLSRKRVLEIVSELLCQEFEGVDHLDVFDDFMAREKLGSTCLGHGIAIPHIRSDITDSPLAVLIRTENPIDFDAPDHQKVDTIVALMVPTDADEAHLQILAELAKSFRERRFRQNLRASHDDSSLYQVATQYESQNTAAW